MSWTAFAHEAPELAAAVQSRFESHIHHVLATLRRDGSPRVSGTEVTFHDGGLWTGSMPGSRKTDDLRRDPRFALHAATIDVEMIEGDAKVSGHAVEVTDPAAVAAMLRASAEGQGRDEPPPGEAGVFRLDVTEATLTRVKGDRLHIDTWFAGRPLQHVERD